MQMDVAQIKEALGMLERINGIREETALEALKEGIVKAYKREIGIDEMPVELTFDLEKGIIELARMFAVVRDVEDEYLEISLEDANKNRKKGTPEYKLGDYYPVYADLNQLRSATLRSIKSIWAWSPVRFLRRIFSATSTLRVATCLRISAMAAFFS